jgi:predicted porin
VALAAALVCAGTASAQSSVVVSGVLDVGVQQNSNVQGGRLRRVETRHEPSHLTFSGTEDLGGGLQARFVLGMSIALDTGASTNWSRETYVSLGSNQWGTIRLGRQYDTILDLVGVDPPRFNSVNAVHLGNWDRTAGSYINNVVKYRTPTWGGFTGTLMVSPKEDGTSATNTGKSVGAAATYITGPFRFSAAYLDIQGASHRPFNDVGRTTLFGSTFAATTSALVTNDKITGAGMYYDFAGMRALGQYTRTRLTAAATTGRSETLSTTSLGLVMNPTGTGFRPSMGVNSSSMDGTRWTAIFGILDYYFSPRTDIYFRALTQKATGGPATQRAAMFLEGPSGDRKQTLMGAGITHRF